MHSLRCLHLIQRTRRECITETKPKLGALSLSWIRYLLLDRSNLLRRQKQEEEPLAHRSWPLIPSEDMGILKEGGKERGRGLRRDAVSKRREGEMGLS